MAKQEIIVTTETKKTINEICAKHKIKKLLLVCDSAFRFLLTREEYLGIDTKYVIFDQFTPNPLYEDVAKGVKCFGENGCDAVLAIGGGSAIDVAKCIKLYSRMERDVLYLDQEYKENDVLLIAVPTTSGTGSESTRYAVIYYEGKKQSVTHESIVPKYAILNYRNLITLPAYQKKCTMMDALCQSIESWWSVNATEESRGYSKQALAMILENMDAYMENTDKGNESMMIAANLAGRAICISQTTAAHAMSYKLTSLYKVPHGRSAFICLPKVWAYMHEHMDDSVTSWDLMEIFDAIAENMGCENVPAAIAMLDAMSRKYFSEDAVQFHEKDIDLLVKSVNPTRLGNNPVPLSEDALHELYAAIVAENQ